MDLSKIKNFASVADSLFKEYHNMDKITTIKDRYKHGIHDFGDMISHFDVEDKIPSILLNAELFDLSSGEKNVPIRSHLINDLLDRVKSEADLESLWENIPPDRYSHYRSEITNVPKEKWGFDENTFMYKVLDKYMNKAGTIDDQHIPEQLFFPKSDGSLVPISPYKLAEMLAEEYPKDGLEQYEFWDKGMGKQIFQVLVTDPNREKTQEEKILEYIKGL